MKKLTAAVAAAVAVFALAALSGVALAGDHHGDHGPHGKGQKSESAQISSSSSSDDSQPGIKPSDTTDKNTSCSTGGGQGSSATCTSDKSSKPDASKRYGNGETAAQIANGKGAPANTQITGPGNSQPHKICGRDVHAYKGGDCSKQTEQKPAKSQEQQQQQQQEQMVTFCDMESATSGKLETKAADEVAGHEFNGNPEESRDIVPPFTLNGKTFSENWDANGQAIFNAGCNGASGVQGVKTTEQNEHGKVFICHATGSATNPFVLIHVSVNAEKAHLRHQGGRDVLLGANAGPCPTATQQKAAAALTPAATTTTTPVTTTSTVAATTTVATTTTTAAAAATTTAPTTTPSNTSGVKGASKTIAAPAASSTPSSGVLGTAKTLGSSATTGTLPFTGLRLWIVELVALGLIGGGVAMRLLARRRTN